jgi:hypothetical protein
MFRKIVNGCAIGTGIGVVGVAAVAGLLAVDAHLIRSRGSELSEQHLQHYRARWQELNDAHSVLRDKFVSDSEARWARASADAETIRVLRQDLIDRVQQAYEINQELVDARVAYQLEHELQRELAGRIAASRDGLKAKLDAVSAALAE